MTTARLPDGYIQRAPAIEDAEAVAGVIAACQRADMGEAEMTAEELVQDWQGLDLNEEAVVVAAVDGRIVASADVLNRSHVSVSVYGNVHPEARGRGIGRFLVDWGEAWAEERIGRAPAEARVIVQHYIYAPNAAARALLESAGYQPVRGVSVMAIDMAGPPPSPEWPAGIAVRSFDAGADDLAAHEAHEDAFRDLWGRPRSTFERFQSMTRHADFDPSLWLLALDGDEIAGVCFAKAVAGRGWIDVVGVRRQWRGRGLALALLRCAFARFYERGIRNVGLSVDAQSLTGAPRVYQRAGMAVTQHYVIYQKELRTGVDLGMRLGED